MTLLLALAWLTSVGQSTSEQKSRQLWDAGASYEAQFQLDSALRFYRAAAESRPLLLPAHLDYMQLMVRLGRHLQLRTQYDSDSSTNYARCLAAIAWGISGHDLPAAREKYFQLLKREGRTPCSEMAHSWSGDDSLPPEPDLIRSAIEQYGSSPVMVHRYVQSLVLRGRGKDAERYLRDRIDIASGLDQLRLRSILASHLITTGEKSAARAVLGAMEAAVSKAPSPYGRWILLEAKRTYAEYERELLSFHSLYAGFNAAMISLTRSAAPAYAFETLTRDAQENTDHGDYRTASAEMDAAVRIADSLDAPEFRLRAHLYRGRARNARGDYSRAIADLKVAAKTGRRLGERYRTVEAFQFLARAYSAQRDWARATMAVDSFTVLSQGLRDRSKRMVLLYEAGTTYLKAGYHERSRRYFEQMVRTIERDQMNFEYAGEYMERTGDYSRALKYYRQAYAATGWGSSKLALAGMVRVFSALEMRDSAEQAARLHDALPLNPQLEILLPRLLLDRGQAARARELAVKWLTLQAQRGNPAGTANGYNLLAEIDLRSNPQATLRWTDSAELYAKRVRLSSQIVQAYRLRALAHNRSGRADLARSDLEQAQTFARVDADQLEQVILLTDLGDVAQSPPSALRFYARASAALGGVTGAIEDPVFAARLREARRNIFDNALRTALSLPERSRLAAVSEWSARKKRTRPVAGGSFKRFRAPVLDYIVVGDTIAAVVHGRTDDHLVRLPMTTRRAAELAFQLVTPFTWVAGGNVDLERARFSSGSARELYNGLLRPLESLLPAGEVTVVLDVPLQRVPFDALLRSESNEFRDSEFAVDRWNFSFSLYPDGASPMTRTLRLRNEPLTFISQDVPGANEEFSSIVRIWSSARVERLSGGNATEERLRANPHRSILHFAVHGISDDSDPLRSHLVLSPGAHDDGLLHASEVSRTVGRPGLVFLSACETASGPLFTGTGSLSLARFFLEAGAESVIATQWPISAQGARLSEDFYRELKAGKDPRDALHSAKLHLRHDPRTAHPFFWASHIYVSR